jgi:hypothetical protein
LVLPSPVEGQEEEVVVVVVRERPEAAVVAAPVAEAVQSCETALSGATSFDSWRAILPRVLPLSHGQARVVMALA